MHNWLEIDAAALRHNYQAFCQIVGQERVVPILKSNAYGHGLKECLSILAKENPPWLGVNYIFEAETLRTLNFKGRILVVGPVLDEELPKAAALDLEVFISSEEMLRGWLAAKKRPKIHVKIDTGMSRQGFLPKEAKFVASRLTGDREKVVGLCTHFANVEDVLEHEYADLQLKKLKETIAVFAGEGFNPLIHAASSASTLLMKHSHYDLTRIGIALYGLWPSQATRLSYLQTFGNVVDLKPVLSWYSRVSIVKDVEAGQYVGYGCTYKALQNIRIVVIPVGYYEGFPRLAGESSSYVLIQGKRCPVIGRVCMNMIMANVTHLPEVKVGDKVTLIGVDQQESISASDMAGWARTIHYELVTRLNPAIPRRVIHE